MGQIYGVTIALPLRALLAIADWVVERPSRVAVVFLIFIVAVLAGPGAWLLEIGLDVNEQVTGLLSHIAGRR